MSKAAKPGETVTTPNGVIIIGHFNVPSRIAVDASALYARNLLSFLGLILDQGQDAQDRRSRRDREGELLTRDGKIVHPQLAGQAA